MASIFGVIKEEQPKYESIEKKDGYEIRQYEPVIVAETTFQGKRSPGKANNEAFFALAGYIGALSAPKNKSVTSGKSEAIAMTAPVVTSEKIAMTAPVITSEKIAMTAPVITSEKIAMTAPVITSEKIAMTAPVITSEEKKEGTEAGAAEPTCTMQFVLPSKYTMETVPQPTDPRVTVKEVPGKRVGVFVFNGSWSEEQVKQKAEALKEKLEVAGHKVVGSYSTAFYNSPFTIPYFRRNEVWYELEV